MAFKVERKQRKFTVDEYFSQEAGLPEKIELWSGVIGPYSDNGKLAMLANWGADEIIRLTGPNVWREALAAHDKKPS